MAQLTKEQIAQLNDDLAHGVTLTTIHNTRYHLIVKVNTEGILVQSMLAEHQDKGIMLNMADIAKVIDEESKLKSNDDKLE